MGRTNKLVDGCYSFWQAGLFPLIQRLQPQLLRQTGNPATPHGLLRSAFGLATAPVRLVAGGFARLGSLGKRGSPSDTAGGSEGRPDQPSTSCPELPPVTASSLEELLGSSPETAFLYKVGMRVVFQHGAVVFLPSHCLALGIHSIAPERAAWQCPLFCIAPQYCPESRESVPHGLTCNPEIPAVMSICYCSPDDPTPLSLLLLLSTLLVG